MHNMLCFGDARVIHVDGHLQPMMGHDWLSRMLEAVYPCRSSIQHCHVPGCALCRSPYISMVSYTTVTNSYQLTTLTLTQSGFDDKIAERLHF